jgi:hypothetical protein
MLQPLSLFVGPTLDQHFLLQPTKQEQAVLLGEHFVRLSSMAN